MRKEIKPLEYYISPLVSSIGPFFQGGVFEKLLLLLLLVVYRKRVLKRLLILFLKIYYSRSNFGNVILKKKMKKEVENAKRIKLVLRTAGKKI